MLSNPPINFDRIDEMTEGDADFKAELLTAIYNSLHELRDKYLEGSEQQNENTIQEIRHKVKPALSLFEINQINDILNDGKDILAEKGFSKEFIEHLDAFLDAVQDAIDFVRPYIEVKE
jgi:translation elongation factor EF-G